MTALSKLIRQMAMATALVGAGMGMAQAETIKLTILGVGDVYNFEGGKVRGGFARLNAVAKAEKAANPNFLYLFDGDMFSPSLLSGFDKGENTVTLTNLVPFDLAVPGNHEFDFGTENFKALVAKSKYPWAAINLTQADGTPVPGVSVKPVIKEIAGLKIGLVPAADESSPITSSTGDYKFGPSVEMSIAAAKDLRKQGADLVIAVFQGDHAKDFKLLASHAFDLILSGDDHDYWTAYDGVAAYIETSTDANYLTPIDLTVDLQVKDGKRTVTWSPNFRFVDTATVKPDPETQQIVDGFKKKLSDELNVEIGKTVGALDSRRNVVRKEEATMGNLIADAIKDVTGADFAITNGGGIRADKQYAAGSPLTRKDIFSELPFGNLTTALQLSGKDVLAALENGVSQVEEGAGRFPQVSAGLIVTYDVKKPAGSRLVSVTWNGKPIDPAGSYKVATNDYMLSGGDGYTSFKNGKVLINEREGHLMASDVIDWITKKGSVDVKIEGRIVAAK